VVVIEVIQLVNQLVIKRKARFDKRERKKDC